MTDSQQSKNVSSVPDLGKFKDPQKAGRGCRSALLFIWLVIGSLIMAVLGLVALWLIESAMRTDPEQYQDVSRLVQFSLKHRAWIIALSAVPALLGIVALHPRNTRFSALILGSCGTLFLGALMYVVFAAFLALLIPLYQYQPI